MDPSRELLVAIVNRLKGNSAVQALVGQRIYDRVPTGNDKPASPYISLGPSDIVTDDMGCFEGNTITIQIDAWSWGAGEAYSSLQVRDIAYAVRQALKGWEPNLTNNALSSLEHVITRILRASDGVINHAAMTFEAFVEKPAS